jgi:hypothetical protein
MMQCKLLTYMWKRSGVVSKTTQSLGNGHLCWSKCYMPLFWQNLMISVGSKIMNIYFCIKRLHGNIFVILYAVCVPLFNPEMCMAYSRGCVCNLRTFNL